MKKDKKTTFAIGLSNVLDNEAEFIPLLSPEDEETMSSEEIPSLIPILPLRNTVLFPGVVIPITVGRDKSIRLIRDNYKKHSTIGVVAQKDAEIEDPTKDDLYNIGTIAYIIKILQLPDGNTTAIIQGKRRFQTEEIVGDEPYFVAKVSEYNDIDNVDRNDKEFIALTDSIREMAIKIIEQSPNMPTEATFAVKNIGSSVFLINFVASNLNIPIEEKQNVLNITDLNKRAQIVLELLSRELQMIELKNQIQSKVKTEMDRQQRDYVLNQQLKLIQDELGNNPNEQHIAEIKKKAEAKKWPQEAFQVYERELTKLSRINPMAMEYSMQLNYLDVLVDLPWETYTKDNFDLRHARKVLDEDHYGMDKIKERIIEYLAVLKLKGNMKSPIICLVGPPGVGKTSLGKSIARAVDRNYIRISLGGLHDESEIRGHRKTYIGAMPGRIAQSLRKAKSSNPVFVLDEIDKISGMTINGDPAAALLEVLDPEQNVAFYDNYLETELDLSKVMFIATANSLSSVHPALIDRMEIINLNGYLLEEKTEIATRHLIPKQLREHGVSEEQLVFTKPILHEIIENYTKESGVRYLDKTIAKIIRNRAKFIVMKKRFDKSLDTKDIEEILGPAPFNHEKSYDGKTCGIATGLAWTSVGGEILFIEVSVSQGKGNLSLTGNLGDVMKESAQIAFEYLKSHAKELDISPTVFQKHNIHIHVPEGATPKDGPSAGITMFTALASAFLKKPVNPKLAMSGEITLRGKILPVGGVKEKILAAKRAKITDIILSKENKKDILDIKPQYIKGLKFHYLEDMIDVLDFAFRK